MMKIYKIRLQDVRAKGACTFREIRRVALSLSSYMLISVCMAMSLSSCVVDIDTGNKVKFDTGIQALPPDHFGYDLDYNTKHADFQEPGTAEESALHSMAYFVFENTGDVFELSKFLTINPVDNTSSDPQWDPVTSTARLSLTAGAKKIYVVANWPVNGSAEMPDISAIQTVEALNQVVRSHSSMPVNPPVMTGYTTITIGTTTESIPVKLARQIARVDVYPMISSEIKTMGANVYLTGVKFVNMATKSFLFSQGTTSNPSTVGFFNSGTNYYEPSSPVKIDVTTVGASQLFIRHFYLPEYYGAEANQDHTIMVLRGTYNGIQTFYAIAVNGHAGAGTYRYSVERNHSYKYNVTIEGRGFDTEARALMPENVTKSFDEGAGNANAFYELISQ